MDSLGVASSRLNHNFFFEILKWLIINYTLPIYHCIAKLLGSALVTVKGLVSLVQESFRWIFSYSMKSLSPVTVLQKRLVNMSLENSGVRCWMWQSVSYFIFVKLFQKREYAHSNTNSLYVFLFLCTFLIHLNARMHIFLCTPFARLLWCRYDLS